MSLRLFPHYCDVKRDQPLGTNGRHVKQTHLTHQRCLLTPMPSRAEIENQFSVGTGYDVYFPSADADVKAGDQLVWDGQKFNVRAVRPYNVPGIGHTYVIATREGNR